MMQAKIKNSPSVVRSKALAKPFLQRMNVNYNKHLHCVQSMQCPIAFWKECFITTETLMQTFLSMTQS